MPLPRYGAIDIGSNSIRLLVSEIDEMGATRDVVSSRQVVRLGASVFREGRVSDSAMERALEALGVMAEEIRNHGVLGIRAVGTAALRDAANREVFLSRAAELLGAPVETVSGLEEARLVHLGVQARWPQGKRKVVVADIGGGSAEVILSESGHIAEAVSKPVGAVRLTEMFLKKDPPEAREVARMEKYVEERFSGLMERIKHAQPERMIVTSATGAVAVCAANNIRRTRRDEADKLAATTRQIGNLYRSLVTQDVVGRRGVTGIGPRRAEIVVAGVAVLNHLATALRMPRVYYSSAGVREGIIADLVKRKVGAEPARLDGDQRRLALSMARRYGLSPAHVKQVARLARMLFEAMYALHGLPASEGRILEAAAHLYNIGHYVNESRHHHHSYYLVLNSDLSGFSSSEREMIACLCRYHRKSLPQTSHPEFAALDETAQNIVAKLIPLLRLAVALDQSQEQRVDMVTVSLLPQSVTIRVQSTRDFDIEKYYAEQTAQVFRSTYGRDLLVSAAN